MEKEAAKVYNRLFLELNTKSDILFEAIQRQLDIPKESITWGDVADLNRANEAMDEFMERMGDIWK